MPSVNLETADAAELAASLQAYNGHPAYGLDQLRSDLDRFAFSKASTANRSSSLTAFQELLAKHLAPARLP